MCQSLLTRFCLCTLQAKEEEKQRQREAQEASDAAEAARIDREERNRARASGIGFGGNQQMTASLVRSVISAPEGDAPV